MADREPAPFPTLSRYQIAWILGSLLVAGWLVWLLGPVLTPFFISVEINLQSFDVERARTLIQECFSNIAGAAGNVLSVMTPSGGRFLVWISSMILAPLVAFYLLRDWRLLMDTWPAASFSASRASCSPCPRLRPVP